MKTNRMDVLNERLINLLEQFTDEDWDNWKSKIRANKENRKKEMLEMQERAIERLKSIEK